MRTQAASTNRTQSKLSSLPAVPKPSKTRDSTSFKIRQKANWTDTVEYTWKIVTFRSAMQTTIPTPQLLTQPPLPAPTGAGAQLPKLVSMPVGTLSITLAPQSSVHTPLSETPAVWVGVATLIGVVATIAFGWSKMKKELAFSAAQSTMERNQSRDQANLDRQHATDQAHQERITKARREVYLELISEMTKAQFAISQFPTQDIQKLEIQAGFGGLATATSKISILGEMITVAKSRELLSAINESMMRMLVFLLPMEEQRAIQRGIQKKIDMHREELFRLATELRIKRGHYSVEAHDMNREYDAREALVAQHEQEIEEAKLVFNKAYGVYSDALLEETIAISAKVDELVVAIREELGLITSMSELRASSNAMYASARTAIKRLRKETEE
ncbi:hypothetical protein IFT68_14095 [Oxalobacteraceae sp. CFBP 13730]|nr:hypothetical protein [Oxalobacteraceae sp. CFBP 13730]